MKAAVQLVVDLFRSDTSEAPVSNTSTLDSDYTEIPLYDIEAPSADFTESSWAYFTNEFARHPTCVGDLLLGIGLGGRDGRWWWIPSAHPIAKLLLDNALKPQGKHKTLLRYDRAMLVLGQRSLAALFSEKALRSEGMLKTEEEEDEEDDYDDEDDAVDK